MCHFIKCLKRIKQRLVLSVHSYRCLSTYPQKTMMLRLLKLEVRFLFLFFNLIWTLWGFHHLKNPYGFSYLTDNDTGDDDSGEGHDFTNNDTCILNHNESFLTGTSIFAPHSNPFCFPHFTFLSSLHCMFILTSLLLVPFSR